MAIRRNAPKLTVEQVEIRSKLMRLAAEGKREEYDALVAVFNAGFDEPEMVSYDRLPTMCKPQVTVETAASAYISVNIEEDPIFDEEGNEAGCADYVLIEKIYVPKHHRRQGIARKMLRDAITEAKKEHPLLPIKIAALPFDDEECEMSDLVAFYESEGFDIENTDGHAVIMSM